MCGIAGFIDFNKDSTAESLIAMAGSLFHRGPDGGSNTLDYTDYAFVGLGHRRLSVVDLSSSASQPMTYDNLRLIFNGEIYNYAEIRHTLFAMGHQFFTHSDTEVILHAWKEWGPDCLQRFVGMFAIVLYDLQAQEVYLVRDRAGVKPFFWYHHNGLFLFASELKAFHAHPLFEKELDTDSMATYFQFGYVPSPFSIFKHVRKLEPGHYLRIDLRSRRLDSVKYWDVLNYYNRPKLDISLPDAIQETERILEKAFTYRLVSDVPVGVFLSGGYDSTCVTALLQKKYTTKLNTFTIGVHDKGLDEAPYARAIASHLGTNHTEYYCTTKEALEIIPELPFNFDEPFGDSSAIPTTLVSRLARQQVTAALSADAGDEIFAGYNKYDYVSRVKHKIDVIPPPLRKQLAGLLKVIPAHRIPYFSKTALFTTRYKKFMHLLGDNSARELMLNMSSLWFPHELDRLLLNKPFIRNGYFDESLQNPYHDDLSYMMAIDYKTYMLDDILQKVDRATMSVGLEGREPFLDHNIIEFAAQLPSNYKLHRGVKKHILREIVHQYVPRNLMDRPKMGFGIPIANWLNNELRPLVEEVTEPKFLVQQALFDAGEIAALKNSFFNGKEELHTRIWYLLMFQMWYKRWM
jgi:asparagine synthase (glutamine-hydrolysing)